jgi:hypothetical protein
VSRVTTRKRPLTAKEDLAESKRRAKAARTPIAKAVTKQVVETKERVYSGQAAKKASTAAPRATAGRAAATVTPRRTPARRRSA